MDPHLEPFTAKNVQRLETPPCVYRSIRRTRRTRRRKRKKKEEEEGEEEEEEEEAKEEKLDEEKDNPINIDTRRQGTKLSNRET